VEFLTYAVAAAYVEMSSGSQGALITFPTMHTRDLQLWIEWFEGEGNQGNTSDQPAKLRVVEALRTKLNSVNTAIDASFQR
jgi:hypothetical protein